MNRYFWKIPAAFLITILLIFSFKIQARPEQIREIKWIHKAYINSTVNPATYEYLANVVKTIDKADPLHSLVLIEMDTPGGLVTTTKDILTLFGKSEFPFVVWVHPEGGSATSAGALIASGAHFIFMAEGTNIGAATPIEMSGNIGGKDSGKSDLRAKAINDLVALVKSLSNLRARNGDKFAEMITKAASFTAIEAAKLHLINGIANTETEIFEQLQNSEVKLQGDSIELRMAADYVIKEHPMDPGQKLLNTLAHPSLAYIFFLIGAALIYLELQAPGGYIAGSIGALCLLLSGIGLQVLPLNFGALGLIILSFILFILEAFVTSFGLLSIAGFASLIFGSLFLYRTDDSYITFSTTLIIATVAAIASFLAICLYFILRDQQNIGKEKFNSQIGRKGKVVKNLEDQIYQVKIGGEFWNAHSSHTLEIGDSVKVIKRDFKNDESILNIEKI